MEILDKVKSLLPAKVISRVELEGSEIIAYTKDREFFRTHESTVRDVAMEIKKRIEVRPEKDLTMDQNATKNLVKGLVPEEAKIDDIYFEPERSLVIIAAEKPGLVIGRGGETFRKIRSETFWVPRIERVPAIHSDVVMGIRKMVHKEVDFRKKFLNRVGENIFGERKAKRDWIRVIGLGGWNEVGRSCTLVETPKSKVLIDCGVKTGAQNSEVYPIFNTKEFDYNELDAIIVSHSHLDHCLHPDSYIQLPSGEITKIEDYYNSSSNDISAIDMDDSMKLEDVKVADKVRIKAPDKIYDIKTKSKKVKVTGEHPFFVFDGRKIVVKKANELRENEFIATIKKIGFKGSPQELPEFVRNVVITSEGRKILKEARANKKLKQSDVAKSVGTFQATISELETREYFIQQKFAETLAEFYGLDGFVEKHTKSKFNKSTKVRLPTQTSKELCQFIGYLLGDGDRSDRVRKGKRYTVIHATDKDRKNLELYQSLAEMVFGVKGRIREADRKRLLLHSPILLDFINSISMDILCRSPYRKIPRLIHKVSKEEVAAFLKGLFDAEGSVGHHQLRLTSTSYDIVQVAQMLLLRFGIISHIYEAGNPKSTRLVYQLAISHPDSMMKFYKSIGFGSHAKSQTLEELIFTFGIGSGVGERMFRLPLSAEFVLELAEKLGLRKTDLTKLGINYGHYLEGHVPSVEKAGHIIGAFEKVAKEKNMDLEELSYMRKVIGSDMLWEPVEKIETVKSDMEYVYDLKVPGHHNYIANGIVVHNCGAVPILYEYGYTGPVYMTTPALDLATLLWLDYSDVMQKGTTTPLFTAHGVKEAVKHAITMDYGEVLDVAPDVRLTLQSSGHILGSSLVHLHIGEGLHNIVYAIDQKFGRTTLLDPAYTDFRRVETLFIESTYGGRDDIMPPRQEIERGFMEAIDRVMQRGGVVLIPSFSVERAQELMAILVGHGFDRPIYLDGMIWDANGIFTAYPEYLGRNVQREIFRGKDPFLNPAFKRLTTASEREKAREDRPCVIISTSGMMTGGPVMDHLKALGEDERNLLIFVGYQAEGTMGRRIQKGWTEIPMTEDGKQFTLNLKMEVYTADGLSAHSDKNQLLAFIGRLGARPERVICIHGDQKKTEELARSVSRIFKVEALAPKNLEAIRLK